MSSDVSLQLRLHWNHPLTEDAVQRSAYQFPSLQSFFELKCCFARLYKNLPFPYRRVNVITEVNGGWASCLPRQV